MPSNRRRTRMRLPTCTSAGCGMPVPRPYARTAPRGADFPDAFTVPYPSAAVHMENVRQRLRREFSRRSKRPKTYRLRSPLILGHINRNTLALGQAHDPGAFQRRGVHEDILAATIRGNEAKSLGGIEPLHRAQLLDGGPVIRRRCGSIGPRAPWRFLRCGAG